MSGIPRSTSSRTGSPKRRLRSSDSIARSRSSASSSCRSRSASRVTRKRYDVVHVACRGRAPSRLCAIRSSSSTNQRSPAGALDRHEARQASAAPSRARSSSTGPSAVVSSQLDGERERQIRDVRERVARVDRQRREHREDALVEVRSQRALRRFGRAGRSAGCGCRRARAPAAGLVEQASSAPATRAAAPRPRRAALRAAGRRRSAHGPRPRSAA